jgi:hypothetical protein
MSTKKEMAKSDQMEAGSNKPKSAGKYHLGAFNVLLVVMQTLLLLY